MRNCENWVVLPTKPKVARSSRAGRATNLFDPNQELDYGQPMVDMPLTGTRDSARKGKLEAVVQFRCLNTQRSGFA